jgi:polyhydroxyalkanoate synthesis repressor PhaR
MALRSKETTTKPAEKQLRLIKKYPNRRLYDTEISRYITLEEIRQLVLDGIEFRVQDKKSEKDITRSILLQVIAEQEEGGDPIFSTEYLSNIIRFYGDNLQTSLARYIDDSLEVFVDQQRQIKDRVKTLLGVNPLQHIKDLAEANKTNIRKIRQDIITDLTTFAEDLNPIHKKRGDEKSEHEATTEKDSTEK